MSRFICLLASCALAGSLITSCCSSQKPTNPPAKEAIPDRNIKDPKIDSTQKKVEKTTFELKAA